MSDRHEYDLIEAVNWSTLRALAQSPLHYRHRLSSPPEETARMLIGRAVHTAVLEPDRFGETYAVWDGGRRAGKAWEEFAAAAGERAVLRADEAEAVSAMAVAVRSHPVAGPLLASGRAEVTLTWTDQRTGLACKARPDWIGDDGGLVELKTMPTVEPAAVGAHVARLLYHCQLAFYAIGVEAVCGQRPTSVRLVAVEVEPPHDVGVYLVDDDVLYAGEDQVRELLALLARCRERDEWPGRCPTEQRLELPRWWWAQQAADELELVGLAPRKEAP